MRTGGPTRSARLNRSGGSIRSGRPSRCTGNPVAYPRACPTGRVTYQTTVGWSLVSSGIVTLILNVLPGDSIWWGLGLLVAGLAVLYVRRDDVRDAVEPLT